MQLKDTEDNKNETQVGGLRLAGVDNDAMLKKAKESQSEVWDFSKDMEPITITSAKSAAKREVEENRQTNASDIFLRVGGVLVYMAVLAQILVLMWISTQGAASFITNMNNFSFVFSVGTGILVVDAILVNILFDKKTSLIPTAWLLSFLYPAMRRSFVKGSAGFATVVSVIYFLSICLFGAMVGREYMRYGGILLVEDTECRVAAVQVLDYQWENGETLGDVFMEHMQIENATMVVADKETQITIEGKGLLYPLENTMGRSLNKNIPTTITFVKVQSGTGYSVKSLVLNGEEMSESGIQLYWEFLMN